MEFEIIEKHLDYVDSDPRARDVVITKIASIINTTFSGFEPFELTLENFEFSMKINEHLRSYIGVKMENKKTQTYGPLTKPTISYRRFPARKTIFYKLRRNVIFQNAATQTNGKMTFTNENEHSDNNSIEEIMSESTSMESMNSQDTINSESISDESNSKENSPTEFQFEETIKTSVPNLSKKIKSNNDCLQTSNDMEYVWIPSDEKNNNLIKENNYNFKSQNQPKISDRNETLLSKNISANEQDSFEYMDDSINLGKVNLPNIEIDEIIDVIGCTKSETVHIDHENPSLQLEADTDRQTIGVNVNTTKTNTLKTFANITTVGKNVHTPDKLLSKVAKNNKNVESNESPTVQLITDPHSSITLCTSLESKGPSQFNMHQLKTFKNLKTVDIDKQVINTCPIELDSVEKGNFKNTFSEKSSSDKNESSLALKTCSNSTVIDLTDDAIVESTVGLPMLQLNTFKNFSSVDVNKNILKTNPVQLKRIEKGKLINTEKTSSDKKEQSLDLKTCFNSTVIDLTDDAIVESTVGLPMLQLNTFQNFSSVDVNKNILKTNPVQLKRIEKGNLINTEKTSSDKKEQSLDLKTGSNLTVTDDKNDANVESTIGSMLQLKTTVDTDKLEINSVNLERVVLSNSIENVKNTLSTSSVENAQKIKEHDKISPNKNIVFQKFNKNNMKVIYIKTNKGNLKKLHVPYCELLETTAFGKGIYIQENNKSLCKSSTEVKVVENKASKRCQNDENFIKLKDEKNNNSVCNNCCDKIDIERSFLRKDNENVELMDKRNTNSDGEIDLVSVESKALEKSPRKEQNDGNAVPLKDASPTNVKSSKSSVEIDVIESETLVASTKDLQNKNSVELKDEINTNLHNTVSNYSLEIEINNSEALTFHTKDLNNENTVPLKDEENNTNVDVKHNTITKSSVETDVITSEALISPSKDLNHENTSVDEKNYSFSKCSGEIDVKNEATRSTRLEVNNEINKNSKKNTSVAEINGERKLIGEDQKNEDFDGKNYSAVMYVESEAPKRSSKKVRNNMNAAQLQDTNKENNLVNSCFADKDVKIETPRRSTRISQNIVNAVELNNESNTNNLVVKEKAPRRSTRKLQNNVIAVELNDETNTYIDEKNNSVNCYDEIVLTNEAPSKFTGLTENNKVKPRISTRKIQIYKSNTNVDKKSNCSADIDVKIKAPRRSKRLSQNNVCANENNTNVEIDVVQRKTPRRSPRNIKNNVNAVDEINMNIDEKNNSLNCYDETVVKIKVPSNNTGLTQNNNNPAELNNENHTLGTEVVVKNKEPKRATRKTQNDENTNCSADIDVKFETNESNNTNVEHNNSVAEIDVVEKEVTRRSIKKIQNNANAVEVKDEINKNIDDKNYSLPEIIHIVKSNTPRSTGKLRDIARKKYAFRKSPMTKQQSQKRNINALELNQSSNKKIKKNCRVDEEMHEINTGITRNLKYIQQFYEKIKNNNNNGAKTSIMKKTHFKNGAKNKTKIVDTSENNRNQKRKSNNEIFEDLKCSKKKYTTSVLEPTRSTRSKQKLDFYTDVHQEK